ncbi:MAG: ABC transporter permease [Planctomycetota bacterium]|jgi:putative ABC transport system permease protein
MSDTLYLAWRYMRFHRVKTTILVASLAVLLFLPAGLQVLVARTAEQLRARADSTPVLIGAKGSSLDLALRALYFEGEVPAPVPFRQVERVRATGLADPIPLHLRFRVRNQPVVGTTLDYFPFRTLRIAQGRRFATLGECVLGATAAVALDAGPGDHVVTSPENLFDLAGSYPLRMRVTGVLARTGSPDDEAVFVDVRTSWVIAGYGHGHRDLDAAGAEGRVLERKGNRITANASVVQFNEITEANLASFHFHGSSGDQPVTAILAAPHSEKSRTLLLGRYLGADEPCQVQEPRAVMDELVATVVRVRGYFIALTLMLGSGTLLTICLVFLLSLRLRRRELETMQRIGCSRRLVAGLICSEAALVFLLALVLAALLTLLTAGYGESLIRGLIV